MTRAERYNLQKGKKNNRVLSGQEPTDVYIQSRIAIREKIKEELAAEIESEEFKKAKTDLILQVAAEVKKAVETAIKP